MVITTKGVRAFLLIVLLIGQMAHYLEQGIKWFGINNESGYGSLILLGGFALVATVGWLLLMIFTFTNTDAK